MEEVIETKQLSINSNEFTIYKGNVKTKVILQDMLEIEEEYKANQSEAQELWAIFSNEQLEQYINNTIHEYQKREELINNIVNKAMRHNISGVIIDFSKLNNYENFVKFVNELMPRLREIGVTTGIKINEGIEEKDFLKTVDYIVK